jgi:AraC-like DNA-binding protein
MRMLDRPAPLHPLVSLIDYSDGRVDLLQSGQQFSLDFYKISFKTKFNGKVRYGQGHYDFEEGGLAFLAPHQVVTMSEMAEVYEGFALFFHPDLIRNYPLGHNIRNYGFFSYAVSEALFLSEKEKKVIGQLFMTIRTELDQSIDHFSQDILVSQIELLLNYSHRYYARQFITRRMVNHEMVEKLDLFLDRRLEQAQVTGLPTVQEAADHLNVSPRYLTDLLRSLTGQGTQQHIHDRLISRAKDILTNSHASIAEIAYQLGFEHPQSFAKLFRQKTRLSPVQFRQSFN